MAATRAPVWKRVAAFVYDTLVLTALVLVAALIASLLAQGPAPSWLTQSLVAGFATGYFWVSWMRGGQTAGMRAWRLRLVTEQGQRLTHRQTAIRLLWCVVTLAPLGLTLFTAWANPTRQTLYDRLSGTRVVAEDKPKTGRSGD